MRQIVHFRQFSAMILIGRINQIVQFVHFLNIFRSAITTRIAGLTQFVHNSLFAPSAQFILFPQFIYISNEKLMFFGVKIEKIVQIAQSSM